MHISVLPVCLMPAGVRRQHWTPGTGVIERRELSYGCWAVNLGPLEVLFNRWPSFQPIIWCFKF